ncbi:Sensory box histidine kinase/response regulator [Candidatus Rhodobacter oscarellae]|uniref:Sensory box histidine kinase/response regulator n=1 Tax=Candidatus Rhodobacter oscarellae TaxID=1675527 RepID=A0A0J9E5V0_9RHOB|nr:response regulator [Candidatus Rhodobacter lobularis]KMW57184.1 Sensory box histidine kinase/response regulator [Candidatus Rhodobacter lobularis]
MPDKKKILLVEDDAFTRFMMREIIATLEVDVDIAINGYEGCDQIRQFPDDYGLVLMDIHMPKLSGVDATRIIREEPNDPPRNVAIIAVTADERYHDKSVVSDLGMDGFIVKPITAGELLGLVEQYCSAA